jgi:hypothetical protein
MSVIATSPSRLGFPRSHDPWDRPALLDCLFAREGGLEVGHLLRAMSP